MSLHLNKKNSNSSHGPETSARRPLTRRKKYLYLSSATTFFVVAAILLVNTVLTYLTDRYPITFDLTSEQVFQLTDQSKEFLAGLSQPVTLTVLNTQENFAAGGSYFQQAQKVMEQYAKFSDNVTLEYVDILKNPSLIASYDDANLGDIIVTSGSRQQSLTAYDLFHVESSAYGSIITSSKAEQAMTSAILNVTSETQTKAAFLIGHGEQSPAGFLDLLEKNNFSVSTLSPTIEPIPEDTDVLFWVAPTNDPDQDILDKLDAYLSQEGKSLFYFADVTQPELPRLSAFLAKWGIQINSGTIFETDDHKIINFNPYFSVTDLRDSSLLTTMQDTTIPLTLPFSRPMATLFSDSLGIRTTILLESSSTSGILPGELTEEESQGWQPSNEDIKGAVPIAVLSQKTFSSGATSQIAAYGSATALSDSLLSSGSFSNSDYFLSALNTLTHRENVVTIQAKTLGGKELGLTTAQAVTLGIFFMGILPLVTVGIGFCVWYQRRHA